MFDGRREKRETKVEGDEGVKRGLRRKRVRPQEGSEEPRPDPQPSRDVGISWPHLAQVRGDRARRASCRSGSATHYYLYQTEQHGHRRHAVRGPSGSPTSSRQSVLLADISQHRTVARRALEGDQNAIRALPSSRPPSTRTSTRSPRLDQQWKTVLHTTAEGLGAVGREARSRRAHAASTGDRSSDVQDPDASANGHEVAPRELRSSSPTSGTSPRRSATPTSTLGT